MKALVTGSNGLLGSALKNNLGKKHSKDSIDKMAESRHEISLKKQKHVVLQI